MIGYKHSSGNMDLATLASGSVVFSIENPTASGKQIYFKRLRSELGFSGTPASTRLPFGICRATGTGAAGTGSASGANVGKRSGGPNSAAIVRWGPAAITGLTPDAVGDIASTFLTHQVGQPIDREIVGDTQDLPKTEPPIVIAPGTSLIVITRAISVAGSFASFDAEWSEA